MDSATSLSLKILSVFDSINRPPFRRGFVFIATACFALSPAARAVTPAPDGGYGNGNTAEGTDALFSFTDGSQNTAIGAEALFSSKTIGGDTAVGSAALRNNTSGGLNTAVGGLALRDNTTGSSNTAMGYFALGANTIGDQNTASGVEALGSNSTGFSNTATGFNALHFNTTGPGNTSDGSFALYHNTTGNNNTAMGNYALLSNTTASQNTAIGGGALEFSTGANNIALGYNAGANLTTGGNNIDIGALGIAGDANTMRMGKAGAQTRTFITGIFGKTVASGVGVTINSGGQLGTVQSSARYKDAIKPMDKASEALLQLEPVTFRYKKDLDPEAVPQFGLIAEQVEKVNPDLVARDEDGKITTVRYDAVNAMLLNEFLKEHRIVEEQGRKAQERDGKMYAQEGTIAELKATLARQEKAFAALKDSLQKVSERVELARPASQVVRNSK